MTDQQLLAKILIDLTGFVDDSSSNASIVIDARQEIADHLAATSEDSLNGTHNTRPTV